MDLIIGAGITGLSYAMFKGDNDYIIIEKESEIGGYCRTTKRNGFVWDFSGHFFHFQNPEIKDLILEKMDKDEMVSVLKETKIKYKDLLIDYPFQKNIHQLDKEELLECLFDLFTVGNNEFDNFQEMLYCKFGKAIAEKFLIPYNEKLYACDLNKLDMNAMGRFFPKADKDDIIRNFRYQENSSYNSYFTYPQGGAIEYVSSLLRNINKDKVCLNEELLNIDIEKKIAYTNLRELKYDRLISTIPLPSLLNMCKLKYQENAFSCNKVLVFNLGFDEKGNDKVNSWVYVPEKNYIFYRFGYYDNIMKTDKMSLYVEIGFPEKVKLEKEGLYLEQVLDGLKRMGVITTQKLIDYETILMKPAYVHISKKSIEETARCKKILSKMDIYSIGRYGSWSYCSIEDNIMEAKTLAALSSSQKM